MYENLLAAVETDLQFEVQWRSRTADDAGTTNPYVYFMGVDSFTGEEGSGHDFQAGFNIVMSERAGS